MYICNMKSIKIFGACLVLLGIFTVVCVIIGNNFVDSPSLETAYRIGMLTGAAIAEVVVGNILLFLSQNE